jgi:hypothetical protein
VTARFPALFSLLFLLSAGGNAYAPGDIPPGASQPVRYGLLWLDIDPGGAHIALDGEFLDRGVWLISMRPGLHDISVRKEGFLPWSRRIGIGPGESLRLAIRLEPGPPK